MTEKKMRIGEAPDEVVDTHTAVTVACRASKASLSVQKSGDQSRTKKKGPSAYSRHETRSESYPQHSRELWRSTFSLPECGPLVCSDKWKGQLWDFG